MKNRLLFFFGFCFGLQIGVQAQSIGPSTLNATGGSRLVAGNTFEWSVGEMTLVNTYISAGLVVTQGVLQPSAKPTGVASTNLLSSHLKVYPNPVEQLLFLQPDLSQGSVLNFRLLDAAGRTVLVNEITLISGKELQRINLSAFTAGHYLLELMLTQPGKTITNTYQIDKLH